MSQELLQRELETLRQRVFFLEKALSDRQLGSTSHIRQGESHTHLFSCNVTSHPNSYPPASATTLTAPPRNASPQEIDRDSEQQTTQGFLQAVIDALPVAVFVKDAQDLRFVFWNRAAQEQLHLQTESILGKTDDDLFPPEQAAASMHHDRQVLASPCSSLLISEEKISAPTGAPRVFQLQKTVIPNAQSQPQYLLVVREDITDRKTQITQLEQQATQLTEALQNLQQAQAQLIQTEKMSSLGQLVAGVAHEINNPINFIVGNLKYAERYAHDLLTLVRCYHHHYPQPVPEVQTLLEDIDLDFLLEDMLKLHHSMKVGAERICQIVQSLRTFARLDESEYKAVDLHAGIESALLILHSRLKAQSHRPGITLLKEYGDLPLVECYAGELNQVFMNLLSNAIDAIEERLVHFDSSYQPQIRIITTLDANDREGQRIRICIADNGCGMTEAIQQQLFTPFFTTKPLGKGSGIGLSISHQIITERHGGTIDYRSTPNHGTEFILTIPFLATA